MTQNTERETLFSIRENCISILDDGTYNICISLSIFASGDSVRQKQIMGGRCELRIIADIIYKAP